MFAALRRFADRPAAERPCDLCGAELASRHDHVQDAQRRDLRCACPACALILAGGAETRWRAVPFVIEPLPDAGFTEGEWEALAVPVSVAFFHRHGATGEMRAVYPSPAGGTESPLVGSAWDTVFARRLPGGLAPDVEALLVSRIGSRHEQYRVSIDVAYTLVGIMRTHWSGFSGGPAVWETLERFFAGLRNGEVVHA